MPSNPPVPPVPPDRGRQPFLHDLITLVAAPVLALSGPGGDIRPGGAQGLYCADRRILAQAALETVLLDGQALDVEPIGHALLGSDNAAFTAVLRGADPGADPTLWLRRHRRVDRSGMTETITVTNSTEAPRSLRLRLRVASDLADMETVKSGRAAPPASLRVVEGGLRGGSGAVTFVLATDAASVRPGEFVWVLLVPAGGTAAGSWTVRVHDLAAVVVPPRTPDFPVPTVDSPDPRLPALLSRSLQDLHALRAATRDGGTDTFLTAGAPWYLTLFGRDSIWAARMLLPVTPDLAGGTLRILAARQGTRVDPDTAEEPGKILHEVRRADAADLLLPPVYFGTIDATPLWICLLGEARRWGLPEAEVAALIPALERALGWLETFGDPDGDGFLEYLDSSSRGLTNQGWKDSGDAVRFADGHIADGPVALAEVQGYAYQAALEGAALLEAFDRPGGDHWRAYAAELRERFRNRFWCEDNLGRYPALALDGTKQRVDAPASNMGHLLATGILDPDEAAAVADRLLHPSLASGFGLRTMSTTAGGYSPLSYHCGSVWPHDTAIALHGLVRAGFPEHAAELAGQLVAAGYAFDGRMPELFGGFDRSEEPTPLPYPASCRPQAWSAAAAVVLLQAVLGLEVDVPGGWFRLQPGASGPALRVTGLRLAGVDFALTTDGGSTSVQYDGPLQPH